MYRSECNCCTVSHTPSCRKWRTTQVLWSSSERGISELSRAARSLRLFLNSFLIFVLMCFELFFFVLSAFYHPSVYNVLPTALSTLYNILHIASALKSTRNMQILYIKFLSEFLVLYPWLYLLSIFACFSWNRQHFRCVAYTGEFSALISHSKSALIFLWPSQALETTYSNCIINKW
jgi:hypothetical protein